MKKLIRTFKQISILILAITFLGCEDDEAVLPQVIAGFTYTLNEDTGAVTFINISENANTYEWDFGDESSSTLINPVKVFPNGTYTTTLKAKNVAGASATFEDEVTISIPNPIALPVTFDDSNVAYDVATFSGTSFEILANPDVSGTNDKASKVGAITNSGAAYEGINFDLGTQIDFTTDKTITMNFWADAAVDVLLKLEQGTGPDIEVTASHGGTGWEMINFDFNSSDKYVRVTLFVDGPGTTAGTFYIDDIEQIETPAATSGCNDIPVAAASLPLDFEGCATFPSADNFGSGITSELTVNPSKTGINTSDFVLKVDKPTGSDFFAGIQNTFASNFDLTTTNVFKVKVYSTKANAVFRFELAVNPQTDPVTGNPAPVFVTIPTAEEWTEVEFTFTGLPGGPTAYNQLVIKPDNDQSDSAITAGGTYYLDDLTLSSGGGSATAPTTAAPTPTAAASDVISVYSDAYTDVSGTDYNPGWGQSTVYTEESIAGDNTMLYTGLDYQGIVLGSAQDASGMEFLHIDFWTANSTALNAFLISTGPVETAKALAVPTSGWASIDIPLSDFAGVNLADVIQMKFDGNGDIYLDNIYFYKTGGGTACTPETMQSLGGADLNLTFMADPSGSIIEDGGDFEWIDNPDFDNAVNSSCKVGQITKLGNNPWDNNQIDLDAKLDFNANEGLKIKVWSAIANTEVRIKLEEIGNPGNNTEQFLTTSVTSGWEELTFPFTSADSDKFNKIVIFFDLNASNTDTYYFDDLMLYGTGGGGGTCVPPAGDLVSNGDFETGTDSCWNVFQNGGTAVLDNTISNGGTWSGKLATNGPSNPAFKQEGIGVGTVIAGDVVQITFDHIGSVVQPGAVFNVLLFGEGAAPGASFTHVFSPAPALTGSWTTFTGTFTIPAGTDVTGGISFLIEAVCGGDAGCSVSANIDNVSVTLNP
ncbi:MAG: carbohydrate binding domain-containing protein [Aureibaculum sp.]|nr:carbohydrate binding domain-containing protein [Aureibaculum sp.]